MAPNFPEGNTMEIQSIPQLNNTSNNSQKEVTVSIRKMPKSVWNKGVSRARELGMSMSDYISALIESEAKSAANTNNQR